MAEVFKYTEPGDYTITNIGETEFRRVQVEAGSQFFLNVWIQIDGAAGGAYGWIEVDTAEAIGLAILDAVKVTRETGPGE